ncbi:MAG: site-specific DNA-methyltransferase [Solirubrobacterales bacterium]|nr:site-specific DNA-methyltransferase [Solirubrobacterales bacterium]
MAGRARPRRQRAKQPKRGRTARPCRAEVTLLEGECIEALAAMEAESVDAIVTDPPYGIGFQHERWDSGAIREAAAEGGQEPLGPSEAFEVWCRLWAEQCRRAMKPGAFMLAFGSPRTYHRLACGLEDADLEVRDTLMWLYGTGMSKSRRYPGGRATTLKPAFEPIVLARRPLEGTTEETLARYGTGALCVEECRTHERHPANVIAGHDADCGEEGCAPGCAAALVDEGAERTRVRSGPRTPPSRFLYCPKVSRAERDAGCERLPRRALDLFPNADRDPKRGSPARNPHPTVKPLELMRWLVRLVCPPGGLVLDPFCGSGTTGAAAAIEGRRFCGIELEPAYIEIAAARIAHWAPEEGKAKAVRVPLGGGR